MDGVTRTLGAALARRSRSRRGFIVFAGQAALGIALALNGSSLAFAAACPCPCGGQCPCVGCGAECTGCPTSGGCPANCTGGSEWTCCVNGCVMLCSECCCGGTECHCFRFTTASCGAPDCSQVPTGRPVAVSDASVTPVTPAAVSSR